MSDQDVVESVNETETEGTGTPTEGSAAPEQQPEPAAEPAGADTGTQALVEEPGPEVDDDAGERPYWPEDWRERIANGDEKALAQLKRLTDPSSLWKKAVKAQRKIDSGRYRELPPDVDDEEALAKWRDMHGIPQTPDGYFDIIPEEIELDEDDKELFTSIFEAAHADNERPEAVKNAIEKVFEHRVRSEERALERERERMAEVEDTLRYEWGTDNYRQNMRYLDQWWDDRGGEELRQFVMNARGPDGYRLGNNPDVLKMLVEDARNQYTEGDITLPVKPGFTQEQAVTHRKAELEQMMADTRGPYWNGPNSQNYQDEYGRLLEIEERMARGRARR